ncbi:MAG TPA: universal stress protein [Methylomirabilota bacterium]|jgi:nucleotide-binding universal stress UspA family protein
MFRHILCATDFSDTAEAAWAAACELGRTLNGELLLVHVFTEFPVYPEVAVIEVQRVWDEQRAWVERALAERVGAAARRGLTARSLIKTGVAAEGLVDAAAESHADLIVIGTHGRTGLTRLVVGSVAERVVRLAPCAVLTIKPAAAAAEHLRAAA